MRPSHAVAQAWLRTGGRREKDNTAQQGTATGVLGMGKNQWMGCMLLVLIQNQPRSRFAARRPPPPLDARISSALQPFYLRRLGPLPWFVSLRKCPSRELACAFSNGCSALIYRCDGELLL